jgi:phosphopantothenoylcysteine decarboxylase
MRDALEDAGHEVKIVATDAATNFFKGQHLMTALDENEWGLYRAHDRVLHIELVQWADAFIIAPCSANTLAKLSVGLCDNLLTSCARAWNGPMILALAMNTQMYKHPATTEACNKLMNWGHLIVHPQEKTLFCGDTGIGAMAQIDDIVRCLDYPNITNPL